MSDYGKKEQTYDSGKNIWVDVPKVYPVGGVIDTSGMTIGDVIPAGSMCALDTALGKIKIITSANSSGAAEVDTLTISAGATKAGKVTVTLDGVAYEIDVALADDTAEEVAAKIAAVTFAGWTASALAGVVTFTASVKETKIAPMFDGGDTGVAGTFVVTTKGEPDSAKVNGLLYNDVIVNTYSTGTVVYEGQVFEDMLAEPIPAAVKAILPQITYFKHA